MSLGYPKLIFIKNNMGESFISNSKNPLSDNGSFTLIVSQDTAGTIGTEYRPLSVTLNNIPGILHSQSKISIFRVLQITMINSPRTASISIWNYGVTSAFYTTTIPVGTSVYGYFFMPIFSSSYPASIPTNTNSRMFQFTTSSDLTLTVRLSLYSYDIDIPL